MFTSDQQYFPIILNIKNSTDEYFYDRKSSRKNRLSSSQLVKPSRMYVLHENFNLICSLYFLYKKIPSWFMFQQVHKILLYPVIMMAIQFLTAIMYSNRNLPDQYPSLPYSNRTCFLLVSCTSPARRNSSRMKYAFSKLKMMSSSHTWNNNNGLLWERKR